MFSLRFNEILHTGSYSHFPSAHKLFFNLHQQNASKKGMKMTRFYVFRCRSERQTTARCAVFNNQRINLQQTLVVLTSRFFCLSQQLPEQVRSTCDVSWEISSTTLVTKTRSNYGTLRLNNLTIKQIQNMRIFAICLKY